MKEDVLLPPPTQGFLYQSQKHGLASGWKGASVRHRCAQNGRAALESHRELRRQVNKARFVASQGDAPASVGTAGSGDKLEMGALTSLVSE